MPNSNAHRRKGSSTRRAIKPQLRSRQEEPSFSDRRTQIIQVSARLFAEYGFETASMRRIAEEVDILPGSIYHHFATKEDILHVILREPMLELARDFVRIAQLPFDAEQRLVTSILSRFYLYIREWEVHTIVLHDSKFFRRHKDFGYVQEAKLQSFQVLEKLLMEGVETRLFHPDLDTYLTIGTMARMLISTANWFRSGDIYSTDRPARYTLDHVVDYLLDCILRMIRRPSRLSEPVPRKECEREILALTARGPDRLRTRHVRPT
jgi:TetR/AcrR family transcriptional regulator, cholesterol catabolism regulator